MGPRDLRGDGRGLANPHGRLRGADERHPQGGVLQDARASHWPESRIARGDLADEISALKSQPGGEIIAWGGAGFAQALARAGLIDQYAIVVQPVAFGGGKPIFRDLPDARHLRLVAATTFPAGTMLHVYESCGWGSQVGG